MESIRYNDENIKLSSDTIYVNQKAEENTYVFTDIKKAFEYAKDKNNLKMYIEPDVYWINDPDNNDVVKKEDGYDLPYGMIVEFENLEIYGLSNNPYDVVLAGNKGQSHGAEGNFTMFHFKGNNLKMENITIGNYCSTDLIYEKDTTKNRQKRTEAITQAQLATYSGDKFYAENCNFIGRLNLVPVSGGKRSLYNKCHFEMTDDSLNQNAVYLQCDFDFYGNRPVYISTGTGIVFLNCLFNSKVKSVDSEPFQYFTKEGGQITAVDCNYITSAPIGFRWTKYPSDSLRCYDYQNKADGKKITIDKGSKTTVNLNNTHLLNAYRFKKNGRVFYNIYNLLKGDDNWNPMNVPEINSNIPTKLDIISDTTEILSGENEAYISGKTFLFYNEETDDKITYSISEKDKEFAELIVDDKNGCILKGINDSEEVKEITVYGETESGLKGAVTINVKPYILPSPVISESPVITYTDGTLTLNYYADFQGRTDLSEITWYRCTTDTEIPVAVSRELPLKNYTLSTGDLGYTIKAVIKPKHIRSNYGEETVVMYEKTITADMIKLQNGFSTDFSTFPTATQDKVIKGFWTVDRFKPSDMNYTLKETTADSWAYGETGNGSHGKGLYQNTQGARLMYTPVQDKTGKMSLTINVDPAKTAGQGFGSAGQYMDICIKFDTETLTGYGIRIIRTKELSDGVAFVAIRYDNSNITEISDKIYASCYLTDCTINVSYNNSKLKITATTSTEQPVEKAEKGYAHTIDIETEVSENDFGGIMIQHTGTTGTGGWQNTTMLHSIEVIY